jgi:fatty acid desaturase
MEQKVSILVNLRRNKQISRASPKHDLIAAVYTLFVAFLGLGIAFAFSANRIFAIVMVLCFISFLALSIQRFKIYQNKIRAKSVTPDEKVLSKRQD